MATPPDFTAGAVLTAAQINAVGLWHVKTQTGGNGTNTLTVSDAFSADYSNYKVIISGGTIATATNIRMRLGAAATNYYATHNYTTYAAGQILGGDNGATYWTVVGRSNPTNGSHGSLEIFSPFESVRTRYTGVIVDMATGGGATVAGGYHNTAASYTDFTLTTASAANWTSNLTVEVWGYNVA